MVYSPAQFAEKTGFHRTTVQNWIKTGKLEATKNASGYWEISEQTLASFMNQWGEDSEEEEARHIGKKFILDQIQVLIDRQLEHLRNIAPQLERAHKSKDEARIVEQIALLGDSSIDFTFLRDAKRLVERIQIPSAAQNEWPGEPVEGDNE